jgi:hypothetical protein
MVTGATCMLRIVRRSGYADALRSYKIFINGTAAGSIARNSVLDLEVPSGPLTIEARVDWGRSRPLAIEALPGKSSKSKCPTIGELCSVCGPPLLVTAAT